MRTNIASWERFLRVLVGIALVTAGVLCFEGTAFFGYRAIALASALIGLDLAVTGAIGFCPLYYKLGRGTAPAQSAGK